MIALGDRILYFFCEQQCRVPVDPLEWQISQETANRIFATLANTVGAAESVLRVAATGHDKRLFWRVRTFSNKKLASIFILHYCCMAV